MSGTWNPKLHPRDGENGRFTHNWERRLAEQVESALQRGVMSRQYTPETGRVGKRRTPRGTQVDSWMDKVNNTFGKGTRG